MAREQGAQWGRSGGTPLAGAPPPAPAPPPVNKGEQHVGHLPLRIAQPEVLRPQEQEDVAAVPQGKHQTNRQENVEAGTHPPPTTPRAVSSRSGRRARPPDRGGR